MSNPITYTQEELEARCRVWQERLRLQDWDIDVALCRGRDMGSETFPAGSCSACSESKEAAIRILDPVDHYTDPIGTYCHDVILVHELLHCHLHGLDSEEDSKQELIVEQAINCLASSLVKAWCRVEELEAELQEVYEDERLVSSSEIPEDAIWINRAAPMVVDLADVKLPSDPIERQGFLQEHPDVQSELAKVVMRQAVEKRREQIAEQVLEQASEEHVEKVREDKPRTVTFPGPLNNGKG